MKRTFLLICTSVCSVLAFAQTPALLKDINTSGGSTPSGYTTLIDKMLFQATDGVLGSELYISDGSTPGTQLLKDINPGGAPSNPYGFYVAGNKVFFIADDGTTGAEPWVTDGTTAGTYLLKDILPGDTTSNPIGFTSLGGKVLFAANDGANGAQLWATDGTTAGTQLLSVINPGGDSDPNSFYQFNGKLYFQARDTTHGIELWVTDGTTAGTQLLKDLTGDADGSFPTNFIAANGMLFFSAVGNAATGNELWVTDGTAGGTHMVKDIYPGIASSDPSMGVAMGNKIYFVADDGTHGPELWTSDGTEAGTQLVIDIYNTQDTLVNGPDSTGGSNIAQIISLNNKLYFGANDATHSAQLWVSDGTTAGTALLHNIGNVADSGSNPVDMHVYHNSIYFQAANTDGWQLWATNGTDTGTHIIQLDSLVYGAIAPGDSSALGNTPVPGIGVANGVLFYSANYAYQSATGQETYVLRTATPASVATVQQSGIAATLYPNPATSNVNLQLTLQQAQNTTIILMDMSGKMLTQWSKQLNAGNNNIVLALPNIAPGNYFIRVQAGNDGSVLKLGIQ